MAKSIKILTDIEEPRVSNNWWGRADFIEKIVGGQGLLSDIKAAIYMFLISRNYDAVLTSSSRKGNIFSILAGFCPGGKVPVIMSDCLWYEPNAKLDLYLKKLEFRLAARVVRKFIVWSSHEIRDYSKAFSLPQEKFVFIPFHHTLEGFAFEVSEGDYLFSGGDGDRDYQTLAKAVQGLKIRTVIATRRPDWHRKLALYKGIKVCSTTAEGFRRLMAGAKFVVISMEKGLLHSGGQQTFLNAMAMGKPVIVAGEGGAKDYIRHGHNGLIVPAGKVDALRQAIKVILEDPEFAKELGENAKKAYDTYSTSESIEKILKLAEKCTTDTDYEDRST